MSVDRPARDGDESRHDRVAPGRSRRHRQAGNAPVPVGAARVVLRAGVFVTAGLLAACGTAPKAPPRSGGYYQSDGPPVQVPSDLARTPDALPRVEPFHPFANRPYVALGRSYAPISRDVPFRQRGLASWYGRQFHGNRTSSGELYDMFAMTAAHPTLPIPSYVRVTSLKSGAAVIVRVNDRGPFKDDRIIDLSFAAATRLGFASAGTAEVEVERFTHADIASGRCCDRAAVAQARPALPPAAASPAAVLPAGEPATVLAVPSPEPVPVSSLPPLQSATSVGLPPNAASPGVSSAPAAETPGAAINTAPRWSVQVGAFARAANADALREQVARQLARTGVEASDLAGSPAGAAPDAAEGAVSAAGAGPSNVQANAPRVERHGSIFRVLIGDLVDRAAALQLARRLEPILNRETTLISR